MENVIMHSLNTIVLNYFLNSETKRKLKEKLFRDIVKLFFIPSIREKS